LLWSASSASGGRRRGGFAQFLLQSRGLTAGWIGQYPNESPAELESLRQSKTITLSQAMYLSWIDLFREIGPEMIGVGTAR